MAILYQDKYDLIRKLGVDESFVLSHLACGYTLDQIEQQLGKRRDRDMKLPANEIAEALYKKLGVAAEKPRERWRKAGRLYLDYTEMQREKLKPRPGKSPESEPEPESVDDLDLAELVPSHLRNGNGASVAPVRPAPQEPPKPTPAPSLPQEPPENEADAEEVAPIAPADFDIDALAGKVAQLKWREYRTLRAFADTPDIPLVAQREGIQVTTVNVYLASAFKHLGIDDIRSLKQRRRLAILGYKRCEENKLVTWEDDEEEKLPTDRHERILAVPDEATVLTLRDPASIADVKVEPYAALQQSLRDGYRIEHIVLPPNPSEEAGAQYVLVKRT